MTASRPHALLTERALGLALPVSLLLAWEAVTRFGLVSSSLFVSPEQVVQTFSALLASGELAADLIASLQRLLLGFLGGAVLGVVMGVLMALSRPIDEALSPLFDFLRPIPTVAFIPAFILIFGVEELFKIAIVAKAAFFPVALATYDGIKGLSRRYLEVAAVYRLKKIQLVRYVMLPATVPAVLAGLRVGLSRAWLLLVAAELLAADTGIGYMMQMGREMFRIDTVMVGVLLTGAIGFAIDRLMLIVERRLAGWRYR